MTELSFNVKAAGEGRGAGDLKDIEGFTKIKETVNGKLGSVNLEAEAVEASKLASALKGGVENVKVRIHGPAALVQRTSKQSIANKTWTAVSFSSAVFDTNSAWAEASPTQLKAPIDGIYVATGMYAVQGNGSGARIIGIFKTEVSTGEVLGELSVDGRAAEVEGDEGGNGLTLTTYPFKLKEGEVVKLGAWQSSGGALNLLAGDGIHSIKFGMHWVRPF